MYAEGKQRSAVRTEECHHAITQIGYGKAYPEIFGLDEGWSGTSTLLKECKKADCDYWQHPENSCTTKKPILPPLKCFYSTVSSPGQIYPGNGGYACTAYQKKSTCGDPSCDCIEWYHQVKSKNSIIEFVHLRLEIRIYVE